MTTSLRLDGRAVRGVLFDWDGTLADSHGSLFAANAVVMEAYRRPFSEDLYRRHYAADWRVMYERLGLRPDQLAAAGRFWEQAYDGIATTQLFPGARESLERLHRLGLPLGLVTAGPSVVVRPQIERLGLDALLRIRVYGDDLVEQKPDPAPLRLALERLGLADAPAAVAYLGDAPDDMRMARALGVHGIGVPSQLTTREQLLEAGAEDLSGSVTEWVSRALLEPAARPSGEVRACVR
jgi:phosphoglycolate phosphatase